MEINQLENKIAELEKRIAELEKKVSESGMHYHYHYYGSYPYVGPFTYTVDNTSTMQ